MENCCNGIVCIVCAREQRNEKTPQSQKKNPGRHRKHDDLSGEFPYAVVFPSRGNKAAAGDLCLCASLHCDIDQLFESVHVGDGEIGENLAVDLDARELQTVD